MQNRSMVTAIAVLGMTLAPIATALADGLPPDNSKLLSEVLATVQQQNDTRVVEADFDNGRWEITACRVNACQKYYFNPVTGAQEGRKNTDFERGPGADAKPVAEIVKTVEAAGIGTITGVDFDHGHWKVELAVSP